MAHGFGESVKAFRALVQISPQRRLPEPNNRRVYEPLRFASKPVEGVASDGHTKGTARGI